MKLTDIIISETQYFDRTTMRNIRGEHYKSRESTIFISPEDFLKLASPGQDSEKEQNVQQIFANKEMLTQLPFLGVETNKDGNVVVAGNGEYHEGRHRARELAKRGVKKIPVRIISLETGGTSFRWGDTDARPNLLIGYNGYSIPFPRTYPYKKSL